MLATLLEYDSHNAMCSETSASSISIYLDSSGDPGWTPPFGKSKTNWYVIGGIILTPEEDKKARIEIDKILEKYIPYTQRGSVPFEGVHAGLFR